MAGTSQIALILLAAITLASAEAQYDREAHESWSLKRLQAPKVPLSGRHPIDAFIETRLAEKGLKPSPEADERTLARRVSFDLHGLPPDPTPYVGGHEELVDRLLASPRYGERWARHWLDTIHFADSHGFEHDVMRTNAWRYRDYVIESLNRDTPWDRFIREQLAADVFDPDNPSLTVALGFLGAGPYDSSAAGTAPKSFEYLDRDDLVTQTMGAFVSTTANCARCHAHKFDPITQEDYYGLQAVFAGVGKGDMNFDHDPAVAKQRKRWQSLLAGNNLLSTENQKLVDEWESQRGSAPNWEPLDIEVFVSSEGATLTRQGDGSILSGGKRPDKDTVTVTGTTKLREVTALRLEVLTDDSLPMEGPGRADNGNLHLNEFEAQVFRADATTGDKVKLRRASADFNQEAWTIAHALDGDLKTAWGIHPSEGQAHHAVFELQQPLKIEAGAKLVVLLKQVHGSAHVIGRFRISATDAPSSAVVALPAISEAALKVPRTERTKEQREAIASVILKNRAIDELARLPAQIKVYAAGAMAQNERGVITYSEPRTIRVLKRGELDKPQEEVGPGTLSAVSWLKGRFEAKPESARRAALADWIADPENPLTWRSIVNRVWHYHFGKGLCDTPSDFGRMGSVPSHPELLDWLAVWFRDEAKGSLKQLHRLILTSAAYRQSSAHREDAAAIDPENRLLWRMNRQRLDAESYRDAVLAVSGRLDCTMGGPGAAHFKQSPGPQATPVLDYTPFDWSSREGARRSIYRVVWRGIADPFMEALDFPDLGLLAPARSFSASPLQALALMNNEFVVFHAEVMANYVNGNVREAVRRVWLREPSEEELADFSRLADEHGLPAVCRLLFNSNEFLFVN
ncbi:MAG TPA: DUF1549 and DUF1553 domain-containing protein [Bryobacteraceae bacterium]|nr:DUF1549 and DUF1553 domain-containing protein [Bryobacteraceae bacterium]